MQSIFREYDIRGIFEKELDEKTVTAIGFYLGLEVKKMRHKKTVRVNRL